MLRVIPIPAFTDNYIWLFHPVDKKTAWVVDPGDAAPVIRYLEEHDLKLSGILITHHHADHTGGVEALLTHEGELPVIGPDSPKIMSLTRHVSEGDSVNVNGFSFDVIGVPGHTIDHIAYFCSGRENSMAPILFCGDTLFAGGCGRIFEGTPRMMYASLQKLAALPEKTQVYCTHEYTMANLGFARAVLPESKSILSRSQQEQIKRNLNLPTLPTTIAAEHKTNIFLRCNEDVVREAVNHHTGEIHETPVDVFAAVRHWKDTF